MFLMIDVFVVRDVSDNLLRGHQLLAVVVRDLESELVLHGHYHLNMVEGVEPEVLEEMRLQIELGAVHFVVQVQHQQNSFTDGLEVHWLGAAVASDRHQVHAGQSRELLLPSRFTTGHLINSKNGGRHSSLCSDQPDGGPEGGSADARQGRHSHSLVEVNQAILAWSF